MNSAIIGYAQNAAEGYKTAKDNEVKALTKYEEEIEKYVPGEKREYLEGTDIRINTTYYMSGKSNAQATLIVYNNGSAVLTEGEKAVEIPSFTIEDGKIKAPGMEITVIKEENNDILILETTNELMATYTNGLRYFNGEEYQFNNDGYLEKIILKENGSETWSKEYGGVISNNIPVFYNGKVYDAAMYDADENRYEITSTDNCETLICKGNIFTKV